MDQYLSTMIQSPQTFDSQVCDRTASSLRPTHVSSGMSEPVAVAGTVPVARRIRRTKSIDDLRAAQRPAPLNPNSPLTNPLSQNFLTSADGVKRHKSGTLRRTLRKVFHRTDEGSAVIIRPHSTTAFSSASIDRSCNATSQTTCNEAMSQLAVDSGHGLSAQPSGQDRSSLDASNTRNHEVQSTHGQLGYMGLVGSLEDQQESAGVRRQLRQAEPLANPSQERTQIFRGTPSGHGVSYTSVPYGISASKSGLSTISMSPSQRKKRRGSSSARDSLDLTRASFGHQSLDHETYRKACKASTRSPNIQKKPDRREMHVASAAAVSPIGDSISKTHVLYNSHPRLAMEIASVIARLADLESRVLALEDSCYVGTYRWPHDEENLTETIRRQHSREFPPSPGSAAPWRSAITTMLSNDTPSCQNWSHNSPIREKDSGPRPIASQPVRHIKGYKQFLSDGQPNSGSSSPLHDYALREILEMVSKECSARVALQTDVAIIRQNLGIVQSTISQICGRDHQPSWNVSKAVSV